MINPSTDQLINQYLTLHFKVTAALKTFACLLLLTSLHLLLAAQKKNGSFQLRIQQAASAVTIDGAADEPAWQQAEFFKLIPVPP